MDTGSHSMTLLQKMTAYFNKTGWPEKVKAPKSEAERKEFIASLQFGLVLQSWLSSIIFSLFMQYLLLGSGFRKGVKVAVCSTSNYKALSAIVSCLLGPERADKIKIFAGDVVPRQSLIQPFMYLAANTLNVDPSSCVVAEDSAIILAAAKAAGIKCIVTKITQPKRILNADAVFDCIGDPPEERFDLAFCGSLLQKQLFLGTD
ncbi:hypothetical protein Ddye_032217 [Dipteronia dyeriana]|uniref:Uncharacterized protein n=1 Tax=Dipteronia dyeriana TaxID=168575 RepID=A0AAD9WPE6_9ROSI|nr:hypothetical protein Ddye_032217 [Dipteronia dyeriana]